jgi:hypothetical protein
LRALALPLVGASLAAAQSAPVVLSDDDRLDKAASISGDLVAWTSDATRVDSTGNIHVLDMTSGLTDEIGPGFLPDIEVYTRDGAAPPLFAGCDDPVTRVAYLRRDAAGDGLEVVSACLGPGGWQLTTLATDLSYADGVRVCDDLTAWNAPGPGGRMAVWVHDGVSTSLVSTAGEAFRPKLARAANGVVFAVWDAYLGGPDAFEYEVFFARRLPSGEWTNPTNLSRAPGALDISPTLTPDPDGSMWFAWQSDRGANFARTVVVKRLPSGAVLMPNAYPAGGKPGALGLVDLAIKRVTYEPVLRLDGSGRPWLFVSELPNLDGNSPYDKRHSASVYDGGAWSAPLLIRANPYDESNLDVDVDGDELRLVYQVHDKISRSVQIELVTIDASGPALPPTLSPPELPPLPSAQKIEKQLPANRTLVTDDGTWRLLFADLHSHTRFSPDGMGERDHALFFARDKIGLDVWASTDHDQRVSHPLADWEYEQGRRLVEHYDSPAFTAYMGFEWTNDANTYSSQIIGHRATFDSRRVYYYTDPATNGLEEYYAAMNAEDAIGVPHHLGKLGGATFLAVDPMVQPISEIHSVHGQFEDVLVEKMLVDGARVGVTAAGDDHGASPGLTGVAGVWIRDDGTPQREAFKQALRDRRTSGQRPHGMWFDVAVNGARAGEEIAHAGDLLLEVALKETPGVGGYNVNLARDGEHDTPVYQRGFFAGDDVTDVVVLPASANDAFYMLRVTKGVGIAPNDTTLWATPIWVDAEPATDYPTGAILPAERTLGAGAPFTLELQALATGGPAEIADVRLHVLRDGQLLATLSFDVLLATFALSPIPGGMSLAYSDLALEAAQWEFILTVRDEAGRLDVTAREYALID